MNTLKPTYFITEINKNKKYIIQKSDFVSHFSLIHHQMYKKTKADKHGLKKYKKG